MTNPLLDKNIALPAFDLLKPGHFAPAMAEVIEAARQQFQTIRTNAAPATFENTNVPLEALFHEIERISMTLEGLAAANGKAFGDAWDNISAQTSEFRKEVFQDQLLGTRFNAVRAQAGGLPLDGKDRMLLQRQFEAFEEEGALVSPENQARIREIDSRLIPLCSRFNKNIADGANQQAVLITDPAELAGVPDNVVARMKASADKAGQQGWLFVPERLLIDTLLEIAESASFRNKIFTALNGIGARAPYDNGPVALEVAQLRAERSQLLGRPNYADFALGRTMTGSLANAEKLLQEIGDKALPQFEKEIKTVEAFAQQHGFVGALEPSDLPYWAEQYKKATSGPGAPEQKFTLDDTKAKFFAHAEKLFGLEFTKSYGYSVYNPDVETYEIRQKGDDKVLGVVYVDVWARPEDGKHPGAWEQRYQPPRNGNPSVVSVNFNYLKPSDPSKPVLLSPAQVGTFFHEFGHAMHAVLGTDSKYESLQGPCGPSDFFEFHSNVQENWALPQDASDNDTFMGSRHLLVLVQNSLRDLAVHKIQPGDPRSLQQIQDEADLKNPYSAHIRAYPLTRFNHLFFTGLTKYAAGYNGYLWSEVHAQDGFEPFKEKGLYDPETALKLKFLYAAGGSVEPNAGYEAFRGGPATTDALLRSSGIPVPGPN